MHEVQEFEHEVDIGREVHTHERDEEDELDVVHQTPHRRASKFTI